MKRHTGTNIFPAIAVYKTLLAHGMTAEDYTDVIRRFFCKICKIMFRPAAWYQHIAGNYHRYPAGMVKHPQVHIRGMRHEKDQIHREEQWILRTFL